ncbi:MAG: CxxC motif-containing protein (DUF1111 family) [Arenicella sp.]|jgi:CxxC motif-containing protein (DUF1111 family)
MIKIKSPPQYQVSRFHRVLKPITILLLSLSLFVAALASAQSNNGVTRINSSTAELFINSSSWADVHYFVNNGGQQNIRMTQSGASNTHSVTGLSDQDQIRYSFTYWDTATNRALGEAEKTYTHSAAAPPPTSDNNIALNKVAVGSTNLQAASNAVDGDPSTRWESNFNTDPSWLRVDLGESHSLSGIELDWEAANAASYQIQGSNNTSNWTTLVSSTSGTFGTRTDTHNFSGDYRYVRMLGLTRSVGNNWGYSIYEIKIFGSTSTPAADSDNDGVIDANDNCPNTAPNSSVDANGCPTVVIDPDGSRVEAEDYKAFSDTTSGNIGGVFRQDDVDIEATTDLGGGYNVGWMETGEWLQYDVGLDAGTYNVNVRVASNQTTGNISLTLDGANIGTDLVGSTGGWQLWETHSIGQVTVNSSGTKSLRVNVVNSALNLNWIEFIRTGSTGDGDADNDGVADSIDTCPNTPSGTSVDANGCPISIGNITPLYNSATALEPDTQIDRGDALITRFSDRPRTRHAREDQFQSYDHYIKFYFEHRSSNIEIIDYVAKGGDRIVMNVRTLWPLNDTEAENRWWYLGRNTVAEYSGNFGMQYVGFDGTYYNYTKTDNLNRQLNREIRLGDRLEFEISQFSRGDIPRGQANYYGTTFLYIVGKGIVPWYTENAGEFRPGGGTFQEDSREVPEAYWLGGNTTTHYQYTNEPNDHFLQMATNLGYLNGQKFLEGRRLLHSSFIDGMHDEDPDNGIFSTVVGLGGSQGYVNQRCTGCHERNGAAPVADNNQLLDRWVFKVGDANGNPDPNIGRVLQPKNLNGVGEGDVSIAFWSNVNGGLRKPNYQFQSGEPARFSARIAPRLVGLGLLEAIPESTILSMEDPTDANGDGISGRANRIPDPENASITRLGRFGWKAGSTSIKHQVAAALNTDMGVRTNLLPNLDCGSAQTGCSNSSPVLADVEVDKLVTYLSGLGVRPQRGWETGFEDQDVVRGKTLFASTGCAGCHTPTQQTSEFHPLAEVRDQTIHPYTDMLLHDMGADMADNLGEGLASGSEWRTTPLWGLGQSACVTGGVVNPLGGEGNELCAPEHGYLHDGRARSIEEAILWHGGEGSDSRARYQALSNTDKQQLLKFLEAL